MEIYLICNNLFENNLTYADKQDIEKKKMTRPLSVEGENVARALSLQDELSDVNVIYSSMFASSLSSAKYLAERLNKNILVDEDLNDCKVGDLRNKSLKMVKFMQNHDFNIKLNNGESLEEVGSRIDKVITKITSLKTKAKVAVFTHRRTMLGFLIRHGNVGYNLDDNLVVEFNETVIYNEEEKDCDIIKITFDGKNVTDIQIIDL